MKEDIVEKKLDEIISGLPLRVGTGWVRKPDDGDYQVYEVRVNKEVTTMDIPNTPLGALRAVIHILMKHEIEIGKLRVSPRGYYEMIDSATNAEIMPMLNWTDGFQASVYGILLEKK